MTARVIRNSDLVRVPWKNGGGTTAEVAAFPEGSGFETFGWRISMADVASDGPFSLFPGIDRTLIVVEGDGIELDVEGIAYPLDRASPKLSFSGDDITTGRLLAGPIRDLNLMVRRGAWRGSVRRIDGAETITATARIIVLVALAPARAGDQALAAEDALIVDPDATLTLDGRLLLIGIDPA